MDHLDELFGLELNYVQRKKIDCLDWDGFVSKILFRRKKARKDSLQDDKSNE